ncbi:hypothetical protein PMAYCL1PPCAC_11422, partial [Pristionchus mayeri]
LKSLPKMNAIRIVWISRNDWIPEYPERKLIDDELLLHFVLHTKHATLGEAECTVDRILAAFEAARHSNSFTSVTFKPSYSE